MHPVDLTVIDASDGPRFDLDLVNYQAQLVNGFTRMTPTAGLEIFMPDLEEQSRKKSTPAITVDWLKDRKQKLSAGMMLNRGCVASGLNAILLGAGSGLSRRLTQRRC